jgi:hypothetical protein
MSREIDARVAREVMGLQNGNIPYSTDMNAAMEVVASLGKKGLFMKLHSPFAPSEGDTPGYTAWWASFDNHGWADKDPPYQANADTPALAICFAALEAVKSDR